MSTVRQDVLIAQIRTAQTKAERRAAVREFTNSTPAETEERASANVILRSALRLADTGSRRFEERAAAEGTASAGGDLVRPLMGSVIHYLKEFNGCLADAEVYRTDTGASLVRPQVSSLVAAPSASVAENITVSDSSATLPVFVGQQSFGQTPSYPITLVASNQIVDDSQADLIALLGSAAAEAIGRKLASVLQAAIYGAATTGQELALSGSAVTVDSVAALLGLIDPAYLPSARLYVCPTDYAKLAANDPTGLRNLSALIPGGVVVTNSATAYTSGAVSGPVLANLGAFVTWRQAPGHVIVSRERFADSLQTAVIVNNRSDFAVTGRVTAAAFSK